MGARGLQKWVESGGRSQAPSVGPTLGGCERRSMQDGSQELVLQAEAAELETFGEGIGGRLDLFFDPDDVLVDFVVFVVEAAEVCVRGLELDDGVAVFREFAKERMFE